MILEFCSPNLFATRPIRRFMNATVCGLAFFAASVCGAAPESHSSAEPEGKALAASFPATGCALDSAASEGSLESGAHIMVHDGIERSFRLSVPESYTATTPFPLVMMFHGWGGDENEFFYDEIIQEEAGERGYILVAPTGLGSGAPDHSLNSWSFRGSTTGLDGDGGEDVSSSICDYRATSDYNYPSCAGVAQNSCGWTQCQQSDVEFTLSLVKYVSARLCVDKSNVFAMGGSNGGMFTWELGQNPRSAPTFRALAPIIGLPHRGYANPQGKETALPVLLITGLADATVPPGAWGDERFTTTSDGDVFYYESATAITKVWAAAHACNAELQATEFDTGYSAADCRTFCESESEGEGQWPEVLDCRADMAHTYELEWVWPLVMDFFDQHSSQIAQ